ncbi:nuclear pore complex protein Nup88 [Condylostylus longicornis]|uniref:nuclear pore complex protein Nup88 n=1 Tax=Condylostylus longicornis TaxID=2530218 RepID=UPI00244DBAAE|nr:nuclear pore complex protein Nup88 [Condylostylus longicornis]
MNSCTDTFFLNSTKMFEEIRNNLPKNKSKTQNLIESLDDILLAWNSNDCTVLALNWRAMKLRGCDVVKHQKLIPSVPQNFEVEKIISSPEGSMICLAGSRGLCVMELPKRWGAYGQFLNGKEIITCKSYNLDEQFFLNNNHIELYQVKWHPGSPTDSHLLVLLSDNTIRVYNETVLRHVWRIGPVPNACVQSEDGSEVQNKSVKDSFPTLLDMGETAVDFDIAPPRVVCEINIEETKENVNLTNKSLASTLKSPLNESINKSLNSSSLNASNKLEKVEWPIVILRGNGNVYVLSVGIESGKPKLQGPLTFLPQCGDNYGTESCSLIVIPSLPPTLVIAESNGKLHHALMIENESLEESFSEIDSSLYIHPSEWTINVLETVTLELGLKEEDQEQKNLYPIHLKRDTINELRYFAYHNTGLHAVILNFIRELERFVEAEGVSNDISLNIPSSAEYIVCTKVKEDDHTINAVLGCTLFHMPSGIVLLLGSGEVISLNVIIDPSVLIDSMRQLTISPSKSDINSTLSNANSPIQKIMKESFVLHISNILKRTVSQPILSLDKNADLSPEEMYKILSQSITTLKDQYFKKHEKVRTEILRRVKILKLLKEQQQKEVENLENENKIIQNESKRLAEKYEKIYEKQQELSNRCQDLIRQANVKIPNNNISDAEFKENVQKIDTTTKNLANALHQIKTDIKKQQYHITKYSQETEKKKIVLPAKQEKLIREILSEITTEIDTQIKDIKRINNAINL